jgi:hypothetical protein
MSIVLARSSKAKLIEQERAFLNTCSLRLFKNNLVPTDANVVGDFTEVSAAGGDTGYAAGGVAPGFTVATLNGAFQGQIVAPTVTWVFTFSAGGFTVYGYYVVDPATGLLVYSERAAAPFTVTAAGQTFSVTPKKVMDTM